MTSFSDLGLFHMTVCTMCPCDMLTLNYWWTQTAEASKVHLAKNEGLIVHHHPVGKI